MTVRTHGMRMRSCGSSSSGLPGCRQCALDVLSWRSCNIASPAVPRSKAHARCIFEKSVMARLQETAAVHPISPPGVHGMKAHTAGCSRTHTRNFTATTGEHSPATRHRHANMLGAVWRCTACYSSARRKCAQCSTRDQIEFQLRGALTHAEQLWRWRSELQRCGCGQRSGLSVVSLCTRELCVSRKIAEPPSGREQHYTYEQRRLINVHRK